MAARGRTRAWLARASPWITLVCDLAIFGSFLAFYALELIRIDGALFNSVVPGFRRMSIPYPRVHGVRLIPHYTFNFLVTCSPLLVGAVLITLTRRLPRGPSRGAVRWFSVRSRHFLYRQLPPHRFFAWWCGGMSVLDASLVALYVFANAYWCLYRTAGVYFTAVQPMRRVGLVGDLPNAYRYLETFGYAAGFSLHWSLWLLYLPLPHSSFLQTLTGIDYAGMIRYHRWLGHGTMVMTTLHCMPFYAVWIRRGEFAYEFWDWGTHNSLNLLAGSVAWIGGMFLWVTSSDWVRRQSFELFYGMHLFGFVLYTVFGCIHWLGSYAMFLPGGLLWMVDLVFRQVALLNVTAPVSCKVNAGANTADVTLLHSSRGSCPIGHVYFLITKISRFQWHPFSVRSQDADGRLRFSVKDSGPYTHEMVGRLARRERLDMRILAVPHRMEPLWERHDSVVIFGGGVGVTGAWAVLSDVARERARRRAAGEPAEGLPKAVHAIWTARSADEFFTIEGWVADALEDPDRWLRLTLRRTRPGDAVEAGGATPGAAPRAARPGGEATPLGKKVDQRVERLCGTGSGSSDPSSEIEPCSPFSGSTPSSASASGGSPTHLSASELSAPLLPGSSNACAVRFDPVLSGWADSPLFFRALRRVQPGGGGDVVWLLAHLLVFVGAFMTLLCCTAYYAESTYAFRQTRGLPQSTVTAMYWKAGLLNMLGAIVGGIGFPFLLLVGPLHVWRYVRDSWWRPTGGEGSRSGSIRRVESELVAPYCDVPEPPSVVGESALRVGGSTVVLPILDGRPDLGAALAEAEGPVVGVYAAGPEAMNNDLLCATVEANRTSAGKYFDYHKLATML